MRFISVVLPRYKPTRDLGVACDDIKFDAGAYRACYRLEINARRYTMHQGRR